MTFPEPLSPPVENTPEHNEAAILPDEPSAVSVTPADDSDNGSILMGEPVSSAETLPLMDEPHTASAEPATLPDEELPVPAPDTPVTSVPLSFAASLRMAALPTLAFLLVGLLLGLRVVAQATLPHIFQPGDYVTYQNVVDGLPVPRPLDWNTELLDFLAGLRDLSGVTLPLLVLFVIGPLWLIIVRRVNPTFRLTSHTPPTPDNSAAGEAVASSAKTSAATRSTASAALSTPLEFYGLIKALTLLVALGMPVGAVWILVDWEDFSTPSTQFDFAPNSGLLIGSVWALRLALLGAMLWAGFHRDGLAGDFTHPEWNPSRRKLPMLALRGACFGLLAYIACRAGLPQHLEDVLIRLQTLGGFNIQTWNQIAVHVLLSFGLVWFALGSLFAFFSPLPNVRSSRALLLLPLLACLLAGGVQRRLSQESLASRYDIRPAVLQTIPDNMPYKPDVSASGIPEGMEASRELARELHLPFNPPANPPGRTLVLFTPEQPLLAFQNNLTLDGFAPDAALVTQTTQFLQKRDYQSALSWVASKNLFNVPLLRFDTTGAIRVSLQDLAHYPHNAQFAPTLEQMFAVCAATPENEALLDQWADESKFAFPDRESRRLMGDLYRRFGNIKQALIWYRKADMPATFMQRVGAEQPMFGEGTVHGVLRWNGKPLAGAQVAVVPYLMNGLPVIPPLMNGIPVSMEAQVRGALLSMLNPIPRVNPDLFPPYHPFPWQLRFISASATTDRRGAYRIDHLTEGTYSAICTLPDGIHTTLPVDNRLRITHPIPRFNLNYGQKGYDLGTTEFEWIK